MASWSASRIDTTLLGRPGVPVTDGSTLAAVSTSVESGRNTMNPAVWVERHGRLRPDAPALAEGGRVHADWRAFAARTAAVATSLRDDLHLAPGDRVAIVMRNRPEYLEALFGAWHAGTVAVPVNARLHRDEIAYILEHSAASVVVTDTDHADDVESLLGAVATLRSVVIAPSDHWSSIIAAAPSPLVERQATDPAWLFYTSGTTGRPKGATLTNRNLLMMTLSYFADIDPVSATDSILHAAPISHGSGLYGLPHVARGAVSVVPESGGVDGDEIAALLQRWTGMTFFAAPTMVKRLTGDPAVAGADLTNLKTIIYGGAPMYLADLEDALALFGPRLAQIYGQGETPMTITALSKAEHADRDHPRWRDRMQSVGVARTDVEVRVVDDDDRPLPAGEIGEIVVRGDVVMAGYWENPDASAETLRGGWLHTGDVGSFDDDGYLTLRDRSKDLIISGGMNIYPREVEEALLHHPGVRAVSVVGRPDPEWGEAVVAFVVADDTAAPPTVAALDQTCLDRIARFKRPKEYRFVDALPTNNYGKVVKRELRDQLRAEAEQQQSR
jgi:acyl-CoA synthetase (AMP-forming)/AMP-acid ligase II